MGKQTVLTKYVKEIRKKFGLTQVELSEWAGVGLRFVRDLEQGLVYFRDIRAGIVTESEDGYRFECPLIACKM